MAKRKSTVKIVEGKVVLSDEVLKIIESWKTDENSVWIKEYIKIVLDISNISSDKSRGHHIIPCFMFKDENHKTRIETEELANKIEGNIIELSIYNHIKAHYCLWKIFPNNKDSKKAVQHLCKMENIENLTFDEIKDIAKIEEDCANHNQTKEEMAEKDREYYKNNREDILRKQKDYNKSHKKEVSTRGKKWYKENKERHKIWQQNWNENHKDDIKINAKKYREENKEELNKKKREYDSQICVDPIKQNECSLSALRYRKRFHKSDYKDLNPKDCIIEPLISFEEFQKLDESTQQSLRNSVIKKLESIYPNLFT